MQPTSLSRRSFLRATVRVTGGLALTSATGGLYAAWLEPQWVAVEQIDLRLKRLPPAFDGFRLAQLSDLHYDSTPAETITAAIDAANRLAPDLIVLTGDYVTRSRAGIDAVAREIARLTARQGVVGVLGNHDHWVAPRRIQSTLEAHGVTLLMNRSLAIERDGARLWIVGADDVWEQQANLDRALRGVPRDEAKVLLVHEPDFADEAASYPIDAQLSGHSHGGQVRLPMIGAPILPRHGRKYPIGLQRAGRLQVYTSRGVGMVRPAVRFNCRPEVTLFTLRTLAGEA
jgi:hypothetical protein